MDRPPGDALQQEAERLETAEWRPTRGWKTKFVAWIIILVFSLTVAAMIVVLIAAIVQNSS